MTVNDGESDAVIYMRPDTKIKRLFVGSEKLLSEGDQFEIFNQLDLDRVGNFSIDKGGDLTKDEVTIVLKKNGLTSKQCASLFELLAQHRFKEHKEGQVAAGIIDFEEFKEALGQCFTLVGFLFSVVCCLLLSCITATDAHRAHILDLRRPQFWLCCVFHLNSNDDFDFD